VPYANPADRQAARRRYHERNPEARKARRHVARATARKLHEVRFLALDGEGVDRPDGSHDYNLLSVGDRSLHHPDGRRLTFDQVASFVYACHEADPDAVLVGFFLGYDFAQWLRDLPEDRARMLLTPEGQARRRRRDNHGNPLAMTFPVRWGRWEFDMLPNMKRFQLRPTNRDGFGGDNPHSWAYLNDTGGLFQTSLLKAIDPADWPEPICTPDEYRQLFEGKAARQADPVPWGTPVKLDTIAYNVLENDVLARMLGRYNAGLVAMGVRLNRTQWHGPGQAAQAWLRHTAPDVKGKACYDAAGLDDAPEDADNPGALHPFEAARCSYFGGWFELMAHGPIPGVTHEYDINSAYPAIIAQLPCLLHGTWVQGEGPPPRRRAAWRLVEAAVWGSDPFIGTMPHRTPKGRVLRPYRTAGWYWQHELDAARRAGLIDRVRWRRWWEYRPCACPPPLAAIADLYVQRATIGKDTPHGRALKLVYNSAYGKMAQSTGSPMFGNPVYASLITAGCRTRIIDAIATHPEGTGAVVMVATDGVYFTSPHPGLDIAPTLGAWSSAEKINLSLFKPGVYWDDRARKAARSGGKLGIKSRGVNERALAAVVPRLDRAWERQNIFTLDGRPAGSPRPEEWPAINVTVPFTIVSPRQALARNNWGLCGAIEHDRSILQSAAPHNKRSTTIPYDPPDKLLRTTPRRDDFGDSTPYERRFGLELKERIEHFEMILPDGEFAMLLDEVLGTR
jgi:hypothetical protein